MSSRATQVARSGQPLDVIAAHDLAPFGFAQGKNAPRPPGVLRREDRDINLDLGPVSRVVHDTGTNLTGRRAEESGSDAKGEATAEGFRSAGRQPAKEIGSWSRHTASAIPDSSRTMPVA